jgi:hypothetical protein
MRPLFSLPSLTPSKNSKDEKVIVNGSRLGANCRRSLDRLCGFLAHVTGTIVKLGLTRPGPLAMSPSS